MAVRHRIKVVVAALFIEWLGELSGCSKSGGDDNKGGGEKCWLENAVAVENRR